MIQIGVEKWQNSRHEVRRPTNNYVKLWLDAKNANRPKILKSWEFNLTQKLFDAKTANRKCWKAGNSCDDLPCKMWRDLHSTNTISKHILPVRNLLFSSAYYVSRSRNILISVTWQIFKNQMLRSIWSSLGVENRAVSSLRRTPLPIWDQGFAT